MKKTLVLLAFLASMFSACSNQANNKKELSLATSADFPPYEYIDNGKYVGIDIEIAELIAKKLGVELKITNLEFGSIIPAIVSGKFDMGISGFTATEERKKSVSFTQPYATSMQMIIVKEDSPIKSVDDLYGADNKYRVGAQLSTTGAILFDADIKDKKTTATLAEFKDQQSAILALLSDKIDCIITDSQPAKKFVETNTGLKILDTQYAEENYAIVINKSNTELLAKVDKAITELKSDGSIDKIVAKYIK